MMIVWVISAFYLIYSICIIGASAIDMTVDLAETKEAKKLEIIKEIRRMNDDGSFIVGYEATDGTFKFESRDVLGNIKGTYGYVDENGQIKRVSYTANNSTANDFKSNKNSTKLWAPTIRRALPYIVDSTPTIKLSNAASKVTDKNHYPNGFEQTKSTNAHKSEPTTTIVYATSIGPSDKLSTTSLSASPKKSNKIEINDRFSKVLKMNKNPKVSNDFLEDTGSKTERKPVRGNVLRRQLPNNDKENFETNSQILYSQSSDEDSVHTYTGISGTQRPLFSTTNSPRIPALVLAARNRAAMLRNNAGTSMSTTTEKLYSKTPRRKSERRVEADITSVGPIPVVEYITQSPIAVQIPTSNQQENVPIHRISNSISPKTRDYIHQSQAANGLEINYSPKEFKPTNQMQLSFIQHQKQFSGKDMTSSKSESNDENAATQPILQSFIPRFHDTNQNLHNDYEQRLIQPNLIPSRMQAFLHRAIPASYPNNLDKPLTARDFERLLNLLIFRHQQYQRLNYLSGQHIFGNAFGNYFGGYNPIPYHQIQRSALFNQFDPRYTPFSRSLPPVPPPQSFYAPYSEQENMYQAQDPIGQYFGTVKQSVSNFNNNKQYYGLNQERFETNDLQRQKINIPEQGEYLPSDIREELLYKMLMLAIQPDISGSIPAPEASTIQEYFKATTIPNADTSPTETISKKPVRSVQILGEE